MLAAARARAAASATRRQPLPLARAPPLTAANAAAFVPDRGAWAFPRGHNPDKGAP